MFRDSIVDGKGSGTVRFIGNTRTVSIKFIGI